MPRLKYFNDSTQQWEYVVVGAQGPQGPQGDTGATGAQGDTGPAGPGLAAGGTAGQIIAKVDGTDYNTEWIDNYTEQVKHTVKAGESLTKGQAVYVSSANGTNMIVSKASNSGESTSSKTMGLIAQTLANNGQGFVVTEGLLAGLNTASATAGDPVWLGTSGNLIYGLLNKPTAPAHLVFIGIVTRVHDTQGEIWVKVQNGFELHELHDVSISSPAAGEIVARNSGNTLWENMTLAEAGVSAVGHTHDDRYYTETETNTLLSGKANSSHTHSASDIASGQLDSARMPSGSVLQVKTLRYQGRPTFGFSTSDVIISYLNVAITPKSSNSILIAQYQISGEATYNAVFRAYRDGSLITTSGYEGYNTEDGNTWSGIAVWPYDTDLASTPNTQFMQYFVPSGSTSPTTLQISIRSSANESQTFYMNRSVNSAGSIAYEMMVSNVVVWEVLL